MAITGNSFRVLVENVTCGSGHGVSIGSLGKGGETDCVSAVTVRHVAFNGTTNGLRIKTWQGGQGAARNIEYSNITFTAVGRPVYIDQFYCDSAANLDCSVQNANVAIYNVSYAGLRGTANGSHPAVTLGCSATVPCVELSFADVAVAGGGGAPNCSNAFGAGDPGGGPCLGGGPVTQAQDMTLASMVIQCGYLPPQVPFTPAPSASGRARRPSVPAAFLAPALAICLRLLLAAL